MMCLLTSLPRAIRPHRWSVWGIRAVWTVLVLATALVQPAGASATSPLVLGQLAPSLTVTAPDGQSLSLGASRGRVVLVDFWASWCIPCRTSVPALDRLYREFRDKGLEVIAINVDERRRDADAFLAGRRFEMPIVYDPAGAAPRAAGVDGMPTSFLVGRDGVVRAIHRGYSEKVLEAYRSEITQALAEAPAAEIRR